MTIHAQPKGPRFTDAQQTAIDYLVLCASNQGKAHANGKNAAQAVAITLDENRQLKAHQLEGLRVGSRIRREASRRVAEIWNVE